MANEHTDVRALPRLRVLAVPVARLRVVVGPDAGKMLELGQTDSAVVGTHPDCDLVLSDTTVSRRHMEVCAEGAGYVVRDLGSTNGVRVGAFRIREILIDADVARLDLGDTVLELAISQERIEHALSDARSFGLLLGATPAMQRLYAVVERAVRSDATMLVTGETGTGKEALVESIHAASSRSQGPLVVVDCSSITRELLESELFGHERGAFTGAIATKVGAVEEADGGTLFLDEIGELPLELQPKFLRLLERRQLRRVGSSQWRDIDVHVIAATHRDLSKAVAEGTFRADLFYRLAVVKVVMPPLRHRAEDVPLLARHFVQRLRNDIDPDAILTHEVLGALQAYTWPGNVRELRNVVERLLALGDLATEVRAPADPGAGEPASAPTNVGAPYHAARRQAIDTFERDYCSALLAEAGGSAPRAADRAGISRQMFHRLLQKHGLTGER